MRLPPKLSSCEDKDEMVAKDGMETLWRNPLLHVNTGDIGRRLVRVSEISCLLMKKVVPYSFAICLAIGQRQWYVPHGTMWMVVSLILAANIISNRHLAHLCGPFNTQYSLGVTYSPLILAEKIPFFSSIVATTANALSFSFNMEEVLSFSALSSASKNVHFTSGTNDVKESMETDSVHSPSPFGSRRLSMPTQLYETWWSVAAVINLWRRSSCTVWRPIEYCPRAGNGVFSSWELSL